MAKTNNNAKIFTKNDKKKVIEMIDNAYANQPDKSIRQLTKDISDAGIDISVVYASRLMKERHPDREYATKYRRNANANKLDVYLPTIRKAMKDNKYHSCYSIGKLIGVNSTIVRTLNDRHDLGLLDHRLNLANVEILKDIDHDQASNNEKTQEEYANANNVSQTMISRLMTKKVVYDKELKRAGR